MAPALTREAVDKTIAECREMGPVAFRKTYGFGGARDYFLVVDGQNFDSKAVAAVAHKFLKDGRALRSDEIAGGKFDAARKLRSLGYQILTPGQNADWSWDEHILALDLYMDYRKAPFGKTHPAIATLSRNLQALARRTGVKGTDKFRNLNGTYMKLQNFKRLDPKIAEKGGKGLKQGSKIEEQVWKRYATAESELRVHANAIRFAIGDRSIPLREIDHETESEEGAIIMRLHRHRERDPALAKKKKQQAFSRDGRLACEVCKFDFSKTYGPLGHGFIEAHHKKPISELTQPQKTRLSDLALVCANCHRMLHKDGLLDIGMLRSKLAR